jgi:PAS domain-containing protein
MNYKDRFDLDENISFGIWYFEIETEILYWSDTMYEIFEFEKDVKNLEKKLIEIINPEDLEKYLKRIFLMKFHIE